MLDLESASEVEALPEACAPAECKGIGLLLLLLLLLLLVNILLMSRVW